MEKLPSLFLLVFLISPGFLFAQKAIPENRRGELTFTVLIDTACNFIESRVNTNNEVSKKFIKECDEEILKQLENLKTKNLCSTAPLTLSFAYKKKKKRKKNQMNEQRFLQSLP
jgi:hypothetical protein